MTRRSGSFSLFERYRVWRSRPNHAAGGDRGVVIHDPAAAGPKDLDDPFGDDDVQERVGKVIADSSTKAPKPEN